MLAKAVGVGALRMTALGYRVSFRRDENILELVVLVAHPCEYTEDH